MTIRRLAAISLLVSACAWAQVKLPAYTRETLPNGATLILLRKPDVPLISVRATFRGGAEAESAAHSGVSALTAELVRRGTAKRSAEQFALELDSLGATLGGGSGRQSAFLSAEFMARTNAQALDLFADALLHPAFPASEVKKVLEQTRDAMRSAKDNPARAIGLYFNGFYYPAGHPYQLSGTPTEASLDQMDRAAIVAFHQKMYVGRNLILIAAGDFDPATFGPRLSAIAAQLPAGAAFPPAAIAAPKFDSPRLLLVDKADATQTYFRIGMPGLERTNPDRVTMEILNTLFGGRFTSMLNDALRVNSGLTYGANSILDRDRLTGAITINTYTRTDATVKAIDMSLDILKQLGSQGITAEQLASAKAYIKGGFPTQRLETADQLVAVLGELELFGLNKGEIDDYFSKIDSITLEQANAVARKYFQPGNLQFCLLGRASAIQSDVKKYASRMKVVSLKDAGFVAPAF